jgi:hypothetical protein
VLTLVFSPDSLLASLILALLAAASILSVGIATAHLVLKRKSTKGRELLAYGAGLGVALHGAIGLTTVCLPGPYQVNATLLLAGSNFLAVWYWHRNAIISKLGGQGWFEPGAMVSGWLSIIVVCVAISHAPVKFPEPLFDPMYAFKNHNLHVKIQTITGHFPADNFIPYAVGEFLLRDIQFSEERPLLPGQEVSNRPILMALAVLPFRAAMDPPEVFSGPLPKFQFVGSTWPDASVLGEDRYFRPFLIVAIVLNATLILGAGLLFFEFGLSRWYAVAGIALLVTSPYVISQVIFTWPKAMAACFIFLAMHALVYRCRWGLAGLLTGLAYLSHPFAVVFAVSFGLYATFKQGPKHMLSRDVWAYGSAFLLCVIPWFVWSRITLGIPSNLVDQNLIANSGLRDLVWTRLQNSYVTLFPSYFVSTPLIPDQFVLSSLVSLPGIIGLFFIAQAYGGCVRFFKEHRVVVLHGVLIPGAVLIALFGVPSVPALHGFQAIAPTLLLLGLKWMQEHWSIRALAVLMVLQLLLSGAMLHARAVTLGL